MLVQVLPFVLTCHCTVGAGAPEAAAVNEAVAPTFTVAFSGWVVKAGATPVTVSLAALDVAEP